MDERFIQEAASHVTAVAADIQGLIQEFRTAFRTTELPTLRDHFAGLAMQGILAAGLKWHSNDTDKYTAEYAYEVADTMLAERKRRQEPSDD